MTQKTKNSIFHWAVFIIVASLFTIIVYSQASLYFSEQDEYLIDSSQPVRNFWDN
jgi:hypothetical protein